MMAPQVWQLGASPISYRPRIASETWTAGLVALLAESRSLDSLRSLGMTPGVGVPMALEAVRSPMVPSTGTLPGMGMAAGVSPLKSDSWCPERKRSWSQRKM